MDGSESFLQQKPNILEVFGSLMGSKMNMSKIKMVWIGKKKHSNERLVVLTPSTGVQIYLPY